MKLTQTLLTAAALSCFAYSASAQTFVFGSNDGGGQAQADLDGLSTGSTISGGLTLTATANSGSFNSTGTGGFGINATGSGDTTTQFDDGSPAGVEFMAISFNSDVIFESIELTDFGLTDEAFLTIGASTITIDTASFTFAPGTTLSFGSSATFGFQAGNGISLASLTVVPEPGTYALLAGICALGYVMTRRRSAV